MIKFTNIYILYYIQLYLGTCLHNYDILHIPIIADYSAACYLYIRGTCSDVCITLYTYSCSLQRNRRASGGEKRILGTLCHRLCIRYALHVNAWRAEGRTTIVELAHTRPRRSTCRTDRDRPATPSRIADWSAECTASRPMTDGVGKRNVPTPTRTPLVAAAALRWPVHHFITPSHYYNIL